jgi:hypothetical protein
VGNPAFLFSAGEFTKNATMPRTSGRDLFGDAHDLFLLTQQPALKIGGKVK